jgi:hypothetical protein
MRSAIVSTGGSGRGDVSCLQRRLSSIATITRIDSPCVAWVAWAASTWGPVEAPRGHGLSPLSCAAPAPWLSCVRCLECGSPPRCPPAPDRGCARMPPGSTAMQKLRIVTLRLGAGRQKMALQRWTNPKHSVVRVALGTGYNRVQGNRRASRNGHVGDLPPEIPSVRFAPFSSTIESTARG